MNGVLAVVGESAEELSPKKPSTTSKKRSKSTGGGERTTAATTKAKTTVKKKKKPSAKRPRRKSAPAVISLKDAKSELGTNDGECSAECEMMIHVRYV